MSFFEENKFDANEYEPGKSFDVLPPGEYKVILTDICEKTTKAGNGKYLAAAMQIVEGEHADRMIWSNFNVENPNPKASEIGRRELADLCRAVGVPAPKSESQLLNVPIVVKLAVDKNDATRNVVKAYKPAAPTGYAPKQEARISDADVPTAEERKAPPPPPAKPAAGSPPPWKKK
jgi:hypothetical protein